jgi:hypothetical protein
MAAVQYESKENAGRSSGRAAMAATPSGSTPTGPASTGGPSPWRGRSVRKELAHGRQEAATVVSDALDELSR